MGLNKWQKFLGKGGLARSIYTIDGHANRVRLFDLDDAPGDAVQEL